MMMFDLFNRKNNVAKIYESISSKKCLNVSRINQGFYGYIFLIENSDNSKIIAKVYKSEGYINAEIGQLEMMRKYALVKVPEIYSVSYKQYNGFFDVMFMEYIDGVNAGAVNITDDKQKNEFSNQVIENLLAIHNVSNPLGFGNYIEENYYLSWEEYYKSRITELYNSIHMKKPIRFSNKSVDLMDCLFENFDKVFCESVKENHLIHGDYNLWNLIANPENNELIAMIDPFDSCFADRELELFQLTNADGDKYSLLDNYKSSVKLSDNFEIKSAYYSFWDDIKHTVNTGYCENKRYKNCGEFIINCL